MRHCTPRLKSTYPFSMTTRLTFIREDDTADEWFQYLTSVHKAIAESRQTGLKIPSVKVAIIDSGVCMQHPIIKEHIKWGAINKDRCKAFPKTLDHLDDKNGHGTHTASVLLQTAPDVELYIARVTNDVGKILEDNDFEGVLNVQSMLSNAKCFRQLTGLSKKKST
jgi:subtilisin family serine protease